MRTIKHLWMFHFANWVGEGVRIKVDKSVYQVVGGQITKQTIKFRAVSVFTDVSLELL